MTGTGKAAMRVGDLPRWMAAAGPVSSWINTVLIIATLVSGAIYYLSRNDINDVATSQQVARLTERVEEGKRESAAASEAAKKAQIEALDKLTKDLTEQLNDVRSKQDTSSGQLQAIQVTNQGFLGKFELLDQRLLQIVRQIDSIDGRTTSLEARMSKQEADFGVLRALFERLGTRK